jgi:2-haloacid dehalogenase
MDHPRLNDISACVFDAYGTLFDISSVARGARDELGEQWQALSDLWRAKQLQYTWLRDLAGHHADFWQVTGDALDYAMSSLRIEGRGLRERLMNLYLGISAYPEVPEMLARLKTRGIKLAILSNGSPAMLAAAVNNAGIASYFDAVLSVEEVGVYKPHPSVYGLAPQRLSIPKQNICFLSSNSWDAWSAKAFGFKVLWCNRFGQAAENMPAAPDGQLPDLSELPSWLAGIETPGGEQTPGVLENKTSATERKLVDYPIRSYDKLRYGDTDRQGHVNNAVFSTFFETGRVELLFDPRRSVLEAGKSFVLARLEVDLLAEIIWPGTIEIGTAVTKVGRSSVRLAQALFQNGRCVARAVSVIVLVDETTHRSSPLSKATIDHLSLCFMDPELPASA